MALIANSTIPNNGMILCMDPANVRSYSGSGTKVYDLIGNVAHTLSGGASVTTINGVTAVNCSVSGYYLECDVSTVQLPFSGFTYMAWARMQSSTSEWRTLFRTTPDDHPLLILSGGTTLGMYDNNGSGFNSAGYDISSWNNVWALWSIVGDATSGTTFYINDTQVGTAARSAAGNYHKTTGGAAGSQPFGYIGWVGLYNNKLNATQVTQVYNSLRSRFGV